MELVARKGRIFGFIMFYGGGIMITILVEHAAVI